jgi:hypothetical protein
VDDDDDNDNDDDDESDDPIPVEMRVEGVMSTVFKLRTIGKVKSLYQTH